MNVQAKSERVLAVVAGYHDNPKPEDRLADLGIDSLDQVEIVMQIEDEFGIQITDQDAEKWHTVGDIIAYVEAL